MSFYTLAISGGPSHDSSICLMKDDEIILFVSSERITRIKHDTINTENVSKIFNEVKKITSHVNCVVSVNVWRSNKPTSKITTPEEMAQVLKDNGITYDKIINDTKGHHLYHASAGFYTSGFDEAACIVIDGIGSWWRFDFVGLSETTSMFKADNDKIRVAYKNLFYRPGSKLFGWDDATMAEMKKNFNYRVDFSNHVDIGMMYTIITEHLNLGSAHEGGKTMGLSAYGEPNNLPPMLVDNTIISNNNFFRHDNRIDTFLNKDLITMSEQTKRNLAYNVQRALEKVFIGRVRQVTSIIKTNNIVFGGGCAMNILGNTKVKKKFPDLNVYPDPIAGDATQSLGAALYHYKQLFPLTKYKKLQHLFLGPEYSIVETKDKLLKLVEQYNNESSLPVNSNPQ